MDFTLESPWNSLEVTKLVIEGLSPVIILTIGLYLDKRLKKIEQKQWRNQKLIEKRLVIYDDLAPLFNDLLCYYCYKGRWKEFEPLEIINIKRIADKKIHLASTLFSESFTVEAINFIDLCYESYTGWGKDAKLRTRIEKRKEAFGAEWSNAWDNLFSEEKSVTNPKKINESYVRIMKIFQDDIGLV